MIRILHVDDEEIFHILTRENLCQVDPDLQFVWLPSAQEALEILKTRHIDCILSDFQMPGMDGLEFLRAVRSANCQIPFILHTGQGNEKVAVEAFQYGADDYFTKDAGFAHYERMVNSIKKQITNFKEASKRRQAESAIVASEAKYKELVENTSTILLRHKDGKVTFFNEFAQKFFGYDASEILGKSLVGTIFPETDSLGKDLRGLLKNPTINPEEYEENENIKRDGERVWVAWRNKVVNNPDTGEKEIFSIGMDISERRNAEHQLHLNHTRVQALLELNQFSKKTFLEIAEFALKSALKITGSSSGIFACLDTTEKFFTEFICLPKAPGAVGPRCVLSNRQVNTAGAWAEGAARKKTVILNTLDRYSTHETEVPVEGEKRLISLPLFEGGRVAAVTAVGGNAREYTSFDVEQLQLLMDGVWLLMQKVRSEDLLKESEMRFLQLSNNINEVFWLRDISGGRLLYASEPFELMWQRPRKEFYKNPSLWMQMIFLADQDRMVEVFKNLKKTEKFDEEFRIIWKDGSIRWIWERGFVIKDEKGEAVRIAGISEDITEKKKIKDALEKSEERFRLMTKQSPSAIELYDIEGVQREVNKAYEELWDFPAETTLNKFNVLKSKEILTSGLLPYVRRAYEGESVRVPEYQLTLTEPNTGRDRTRWLSTRIYPIKNTGGYVENIVITHEDVTVQKISREKIEKSEKRYKNLVETSSNIVYVFSLARGGLYYSPRVQEVLGYSPAYLLKHSSLWHELIHPEDQERVDKAVRSMGTEDKFCLEYRIKDSEGEWHWFLDRFIGQESEGDETFIEGLATDITGLKQGLGSMKRIVDPTFTHLKE